MERNETINSLHYQVNNNIDNGNLLVVSVKGNVLKKALIDFNIEKVKTYHTLQQNMFDIVKSINVNPENLEDNIPHYSYRQIYSTTGDKSKKMTEFNNDLKLLKSECSQINKINDILKKIDENKEFSLPNFIIENLGITSI